MLVLVLTLRSLAAICTGIVRLAGDAERREAVQIGSSISLQAYGPTVLKLHVPFQVDMTFLADFSFSFAIIFVLARPHGVPTRVIYTHQNPT